MRRRCRSRCPPDAGACCSIPARRAPSSRKPTPWREGRSRCWLNPAAKTRLERVGKQIVARVEADAVLEAPRQPGLELQHVALLAVRVRAAGRRELVDMLQGRRAAQRALE